MSVIDYKKLLDKEDSTEDSTEKSIISISENNYSIEDILKRFPTHWTDRSEAGTYCGQGSLEENTKNLLRALPNVIKGFDIKKVNDAGCGDFAWFSKLDSKGLDYLGYDIKEWVKQDKFKFKKFDIITQVMRKADLIICRDVLFHFPNILASKALENFRKSKSKYLLATSIHTTNENPTTNWRVQDNKDRKDWLVTSDGQINPDWGTDVNGSPYSNINLEEEPFNLPEPIITIPEREQANRFLGLWKLN